MAERRLKRARKEEIQGNMACWEVLAVSKINRRKMGMMQEKVAAEPDLSPKYGKVSSFHNWPIICFPIPWLATYKKCHGLRSAFSGGLSSVVSWRAQLVDTNLGGAGSVLTFFANTNSKKVQY